MVILVAMAASDVAMKISHYNAVVICYVNKLLIAVKYIAFF